MEESTRRVRCSWTTYTAFITSCSVMHVLLFRGHSLQILDEFFFVGRSPSSMFQLHKRWLKTEVGQR
jgi:hypothetical protein